jgi:hypothetical protein
LRNHSKWQRKRPSGERDRAGQALGGCPRQRNETLQTDGWIFGATGDRIAESLPRSSLPIHPRRRWLSSAHVRWLFETIGSKQRMRTLSCLGGSSYNLSPTDHRRAAEKSPEWTPCVFSIDLQDDRLAFSISLGETFSDRNWYKLVAGVIELPLA